MFAPNGSCKPPTRERMLLTKPRFFVPGAVAHPFVVRVHVGSFGMPRLIVETSFIRTPLLPCARGPAPVPLGACLRRTVLGNMPMTDVAFIPSSASAPFASSLRKCEVRKNTAHGKSSA